MFVVAALQLRGSALGEAQTVRRLRAAPPAVKVSERQRPRARIQEVRARNRLNISGKSFPRVRFVAEVARYGCCVRRDRRWRRYSMPRGMREIATMAKMAMSSEPAMPGYLRPSAHPSVVSVTTHAVPPMML
jgi:hypothetical protein